MGFLPQMINKPVLNPEVEAEVLNAVAQYQHRDKWVQWGMDLVCKQGSAFLLTGPFGTGKTMTARWIAHKVKRGFKCLDISKVGGGDPGQTEKGIKDFFADCMKRNSATIFVDECDHLLMNRENMEDTTWQLGSLETMLTEMSDYPGLIIMATNHAQNLDPAVTSRFMSIIQINRPDYERRKLIWKQKIPDKFPYQPTERDLATIAKHDLCGRQIENVLRNVASYAIRQLVKPKLKHFVHYCELEKAKHLEATN